MTEAASKKGSVRRLSAQTALAASRPKGINREGSLLSDIKYAIRNRGSFLESAAAYGTPQYFLDERRLLDAAREFKGAFARMLPNYEFYYAFKSNDLPYLVGALKRVGFNADVAGLFELALALKTGFEKIIFTSPGKSDEEILLSLKNAGKVVLNSDSLDEVERIRALAVKTKPGCCARVSLRLAPAEASSKKWSKFGLTHKEALEAASIISSSKSMRLVGLHFHSSWNKTPERQVANVKALGKAAEKVVSAAGRPLEFVDVGGGFYPQGEGELLSETEYGRRLPKAGARVLESDFIVEDPKSIGVFASEITEAVKSHILSRLGRDVKILLEPGRFISSRSTAILLKVLSVRGDGSVVVDGGMNMLGYDRFSMDYFPIVNLSQPSLKRSVRTIYGCLCDPHDFWGYSMYGSGVGRGDILAVLNQGAYSFSLAWRFIKPTAPYAVLKKNGKLSLARGREKFGERYPEFLGKRS